MARTFQKRWLWALAASGWAFLCWVASSKTPSELPSGLPGGTGNLLHIAGNAAFGFLLLRVLAPASSPKAPESWPGAGSRVGRWVLLIVAVHALFDETHQFFVPGRSCSGIDLLLDTGGALFFLLIPFHRSQGRPRSPLPAVLSLALLVFLAESGASGRPFGDEWLEQLLVLITQ